MSKVTTKLIFYVNFVRCFGDRFWNFKFNKVNINQCWQFDVKRKTNKFPTKLYETNKVCLPVEQKHFGEHFYLPSK